MRLHPRSGSASNVVYFSSFFDYDEMAFCWRYLKPGSAFLDAGANIGAYTLLAGAAMQGRGRIDAVEPNPESLARLQENLTLNGMTDLVVTHAAAVGARAGRVSMTADADVGNRVVQAPAVQGRVTMTVDAVSLSELLAPTIFDLVKLDIEGMEHAALDGARAQLLAGNPRVLILELTPHLLADNGASVDAVAELLVACGYALRVYNEAERRLSDPRAMHGNVLAIHGTADVERRLAASADPPVPGPGAQGFGRRTSHRAQAPPTRTP